MEAKVRNPVLKYFGSKYRLADWIIAHFPAHEHYVEPFGGGAGVLLQKPISNVETYNDLDGDVVNFFRVLRENQRELVRQITLTPWARDEFEACLKRCNESAVECARRFFFKIWMSRTGGTLAIPSNWRRNRRRFTAANGVRPHVLRTAAKRLRHVQIENRDANKLIVEMDAPDTLIYCDPPYPAATRTDKVRYAFELNQDQQHAELAKVLRQAKGFVVLSGYACPLYENLYERFGWTRIDKTTMANGGKKSIESLWLSPKTVAALKKAEFTQTRLGISN